MHAPETFRAACAAPLLSRRLFQTYDLDEARDFVAQKFCDHRLEIRSETGRFNAMHHRAEGVCASLNYISYGADVTIDPGELGSFYLIQIPLSGRADVTNGADPVLSDSNTGSVLNPHRQTRMRWHAGCTQLLLQIDAQSVKDHGERLLGRPLNGAVTFHTSVNGHHGATSDWIRKLKTCLGLTEKGVLFGACSKATQLRAEEELIRDFLLCQPSDISRELAQPALATRNLLVKRAARFIAVRLADPLTVADIAEATGVTPRRLQQAFRQDLGQSPMQYLRQRRLGLARELLLHSDGAALIADVCHRAGFSHFGRFSTEYRAHFGETPSQTVARQNLISSVGETSIE